MSKKYSSLNSEQSYTDNTIKQGAPWNIIVLLLILFFPAGIVLMLTKLYTDKTNIFSNAERTTTVGWIFVGLGVIFWLMHLAGGFKAVDGRNIDSQILTVIIFCSGIGLAIIFNARKYRKIGLMYQKYLPVLSASTTGSLDDIAVSVGEAYDVTSANIQKLIDMGVLKNSYIDKSSRCLISPLVGSMVKQTSNKTVSEANNYYSQQTTTAEQKSKPKVKTIKCPNCGGVNNVTEGSSKLCEFCDSVLE